jgi:hypothetical protein
MKNGPRPAIADVLADPARIDAAVARAIREEVSEQVRLGNALPTLENGQVVWLSAEEVLARLANEGPAERLQRGGDEGEEGVRGGYARPPRRPATAGEDQAGEGHVG